MDIKQRQHLLCLFQDISCDGAWGSESSSALKAFQSAYNQATGTDALQVDGIWGKRSYAAIVDCLSDESRMESVKQALNGSTASSTSASSSTSTSTTASADQYYNASDGCYHIPRGVNVQLSEHLWANEIHCQGVGCCTESVVSKRIIELFEEIRNDMGVPLTIGTSGGSGFRCPTHNSAVGGATGSLHTHLGDSSRARIGSDAVDIHFSTPEVLMECVIKHLKKGEYGLYPWGCHVGIWDAGKVNRFQ